VAQAYPLTVAAPAPPRPVAKTAVASGSVQAPVAGAVQNTATESWPILVTLGPITYPPQALAEGRGGIVGFNLAIDQSGTVTL
jgi:hypothetical protein